MDYSTNILLGKHRSKRASNVNNILTIPLRGSEKLIPCEPMVDAVSEMDVYNSERENCNLLRLSFSVNTVASNVCFNNITEIVKDEGSNSAICLNTIELTADRKKIADVLNSKTLVCKLPSHFESVTDCIRDTQLSSTDNGFIYHCGTDICNNHILRSATFRTIVPVESNNPQRDFNTISDYMRHGHFENKKIKYENVKGYKDSEERIQTRPNEKLHVYEYETIYSFADSINSNLKDKNGWIGFINSGKFPTFNGNKQYDYNNVINYKKSCDFVEMYPTSDLFYFTPKFNKYRHRVEKNWNYCLTYPSSSTTENITFINDSIKSLKVMYFDDTIRNSDSTVGIKVWSISKHGLSKGNYVNIYTGNTEDSCVISNAVVKKVIDDYCFTIYRGSSILCSKWHKISQNEFAQGEISMSGDPENFIISSERTYVYKKSDPFKRYYIIDKEKVNLDDNAQNISFKRVIGSSTCEYYVRIFSRLPNWRFVDRIPSVHELYKKDSDLIQRYQTSENDFESHVGQLAYAKNIYNDEIASVTYTDDINIGNLRDNLGRPLSEIFITLVKNNKGYREWYGKGTVTTSTNSEDIEYSHCFGKVNCAFRLSEASVPNINHQNIMALTNLKNNFNTNGIDVTNLNERGSVSILDDDEIEYNEIKNNGEVVYHGDVHFYGDLCCYCRELCEEQSIQMIEHRFNTAQRELTSSAFKTFNYFNNIVYDEIASDDYDYDGFKVDSNTLVNANMRGEGYCYIPHYQVRIKEFSDNVTYALPIMYTIKNIDIVGKNLYEFYTVENNGVSLNQTLNIYDKTLQKRYLCTVTEVKNARHFFATITDGDGDNVPLDVLTKRRYKLFYRDREEIPDYATFMNDDSCRFYWRTIIQNGMNEGQSDNEVYPFTNGALYINKNINLFVRRQDPNNLFKHWTNTLPLDYKPNIIENVNKDNYVGKDDIVC